LVVDDEPNNLDLFTKPAPEYKVLKVVSGPAALELASEGDIAVIISEQHLPLMSGTEF